MQRPLRGKQFVCMLIRLIAQDLGWATSYLQVKYFVDCGFGRMRSGQDLGLCSGPRSPRGEVDPDFFRRGEISEQRDLWYSLGLDGAVSRGHLCLVD